MSIDRLTAEDLIMLWPDHVWPQEIGALVVLDGAALFDVDGRFRIEAVRGAVAGRLHLVPRFRQVIHTPRRPLGVPQWVDATRFDLTDHIRVMPLPEPGDEAQLLAEIEGLRRRRLDRSRPLWEMRFLTGLPEGRVGLMVRMHHAVADGLAGVAAVGAFLDPTAENVAVPPRPWVPAPPPSPVALLADNLRRLMRAAGRMIGAAAHPVAAAHEVSEVLPALREVVGEGRNALTSLDRVVGPGRRLAIVRGSLDRARDVARAHGAGVNDVLLCVTAAGLAGLLRSRGEQVEDVVLPVYVPVSLRRRDESGAGGNRVAQMVVPLPLGVDDAGERLRRIAAETAVRKQRPRPSVGKIPRGGIAGRAFLKLLDRQRVNVCTADVPGPEVRLYLAGAPVLEVLPVLPLIGSVTLGVGALSYAGQLSITVVADEDGVPDIGVFAACLAEELRALGVSVETGG